MEQIVLKIILFTTHSSVRNVQFSNIIINVKRVLSDKIMVFGANCYIQIEKRCYSVTNFYFIYNRYCIILL